MKLSLIVFSAFLGTVLGKRDENGLAPEYNRDHPHRVMRRVVSPEYNEDHLVHNECTIDLEPDLDGDVLAGFLDKYAVYIVSYFPLFKTVQMDIPDENRALIEEIRLHEAVAGFEHDVIIEPSIEDFPNINLIRVQSMDKPYHSPQAVNEPEKPYFGTGKGTYLYILDTGVSDHVEFGNRIDRELGQNLFDKNSRDTSDCVGHGTHVAGTAAGKTVGIASEATIVPYRLFDCEGRSNERVLLTALNAVAEDVVSYPDRKIILNLSLGPTAKTHSPSVLGAEKFIVDHGAAIVRASGNLGKDACDYNLGGHDCIAVAASDENDNLAAYSNRGTCIDLVAPGSNVVSASFENSREYLTKSGTSMASPLIAGAVAAFSEIYNLKGKALQDKVLSVATLGKLHLNGDSTINRLLFAPGQNDADLLPPVVVKDPVVPNLPKLAPPPSGLHLCPSKRKWGLPSYTSHNGQVTTKGIYITGSGTMKLFSDEAYIANCYHKCEAMEQCKSFNVVENPPMDGGYTYVCVLFNSIASCSDLKVTKENAYYFAKNEN